MMARNPDFLECESCLCFAARRAARAISQHYERVMRGSGLRITQFTLLTVLVRAGKLPLSEVAEHLGMERTTLTRNLRPLLAKGHVTIEEGEDRRVKKIEITPQGMAALKAALPQWRKAQRAMSGRLPSGTLEILETTGRVA
jgi:DNA-binding MarR family transcriptional regulator